MLHLKSIRPSQKISRSFLTFVAAIIMALAILATMHFWPEGHAEKYGPQVQRAATQARQNLGEPAKLLSATIPDTGAVTCGMNADPTLDLYACTSQTYLHIPKFTGSAQIISQNIAAFDTNLTRLGWKHASDDFHAFPGLAQANAIAMLSSGLTLHYIKTTAMRGVTCDLDVQLTLATQNYGSLLCQYEE